MTYRPFYPLVMLACMPLLGIGCTEHHHHHKTNIGRGGVGGLETGGAAGVAGTEAEATGGTAGAAGVAGQADLGGSAGFAGSGRCPSVDASYNPTIDPTDFSSTVDSPLFPLVPKTTFHYRTGEEDNDVEVTSSTQNIMGVDCVVVHDTVSEDGEITEDTYDYYAQDSAGNVWYFGEDSTSYEGEEPSTEGSWQAGVDGAKPGILLPVQGVVGESYRQEYAPCVAEDMADTVSLSEDVAVPYGSFTGCRETHEFTPLEPSADEHKYYCEGVGLVLEADMATGERNELVDVTGP